VLVIAFVPPFFSRVPFLAMATMMLGVLRAIRPIAMIKMFRLPRFYSPGLASVFAQVKDDALYIGKLAMRAGLQGAGIGRKLVEAIRDEARSRGLKMLELQTRIELTENHAMFARMGFVKTAETAHPRFDLPTSITMRAKV
jgi:GNAT superfamily N-acetyltransferase